MSKISLVDRSADIAMNDEHEKLRMKDAFESLVSSLNLGSEEIPFTKYMQW